MSDLIRRDDVIDLIMETDPFWAEGTTRAIFNGVKKIRSSCVEPIVRCKDCKYFHYSKPYGVVMMNLVCDKWGKGCRTNPDGYCFMGERKDDADNR